MKKKSVFKQDVFNENPGLHLFYVKQAVIHITAINNMIQRLADFGNINMLGAKEALNKHLDKLVGENRAYYDAYEIIDEIRTEELKWGKDGDE